MGLGGISMWQLLIILLIVVLIFGTKRLKSIGGDLGGALKSFRKAMDSDDKDDGDGGSDGGEPQRLEESQPDAEFEEQKDKSESS
ncbi:MAG TPA: twin-arginine translocase TatA/TatE family subunit [Gammaproteobacteria bacterium]|nr:twin-arginine translocase TatA/TatE family subunit [Gammaproteobacteria bacterium]